MTFSHESPTAQPPRHFFGDFTTLSYFLYISLSRSSFSRALFIIFLTQRGLSNSEVGILQTVLFATNLLAEIPTGLFGDRYGRKLSVLIGLILLATNAVGMLLAQNFWIFLAAFFVQGVGFAFKSGSDEALFYDRLRVEGRTSEYERIAARVHAVGTASFGLSMIAGGYLVGLSWSAIYVGNLLVTVGAFLVFALTADTGRLLPQEASDESIDIVSQPSDSAEKPGSLPAVRRFLTSHDGKVFLLLILGLALFEAATTPYFVFAQSLFEAQGQSERSIAFTYGLLELCGAGVAAVSGFVRARVPRRTLIVGGMAACSLVIGLNSLVTGPSSFLLFALAMCIPDLFQASANAQLHENVPSSIRATAISLESFFISGLVGISYAMSGWLFDLLGPRGGIAALAGFPLLGALAIGLHFFFVRPEKVALSALEETL
jgi:MFS family permease